MDSQERYQFTVEDIEGEFKMGLRLKNGEPTKIILESMPKLGELAEEFVNHAVRSANILLNRTSLKAVAASLGQGIALKSGKQLSEIAVANAVVSSLFGILAGRHVPKPAVDASTQPQECRQRYDDL